MGGAEEGMNMEFLCKCTYSSAVLLYCKCVFVSNMFVSDLGSVALLSHNTLK